MRSTAALAFLFLIGLGSCDRVGEQAKNALNKGGELAGSAATEVIEGVTTGVEETWSVEAHLSEDLTMKGLALGRAQVESDSTGRDNRLVIYLSAENSISDTLIATAFDQAGLEMGRAHVAVSLPAGSADYHTFEFQSRTDLERKSRVEIK